MQYMGGKFNQLKDILDLMQEHRSAFETVVDVFGGAGTVLINIPEKWRVNRVYNDIDQELYTLFKVLQNDEKRNILIEKLKLAFPHEQVFKDLKTEDLKIDNDEEINIAFKLIYIHTYSYFGGISGFMRLYKYKPYQKFKIENFIYVKSWVVENKDFRDIMRVYNKENVLFYLDPPYLRSGKKYNNSFSLDDFKDLKNILDNTKANYILNLSLFDKEMVDVFGKPNFIKNYQNPASNTVESLDDRWEMGFWYKFNDKKSSKIISLDNLETVKNEDNGGN